MEQVVVTRDSVGLVDQAEAVSAVCASLLQIRVQSSDNRLLLLFGSVSVSVKDHRKERKLTV